MPGPALVVSFLIAGLACAFAGLCYAEFASMIPVSGSAYSYSYATLGEFVAWFIGWNLILEYLFAAATVAVGWSGYVVSLVEQLGFHLPDALTNAPLTKGAGHFEIVRTGALINLPAVLIVAAITALCYVGIHQSARFNAIVVAIKVTVIVLFIGFGVWVVDGANWQPFIPENTGSPAASAGAAWCRPRASSSSPTSASTPSRPRRRRRRTRSATCRSASSASLAVCTVLYVAVSAVLTGMVPYSELNTPAPVALALDRHPELSWLAGWIKLGAIAGLTSVILVMMLGQPRIFYAMSRDGLLPPLFRRVHPTHKTPYVGTLITGSLAATHRGAVPGDDPGRARVDRHAARLHHRVHRRAGAALHAAGHPAPFQGARPLARLHLGRAGVHRHDAVAAAGHLGPAARVDDPRIRDLLLLRVPAQRAAQGRPVGRLPGGDYGLGRSWPAARASRRVAQSEASTPPASVQRMMPSETRFGTWKCPCKSIFTPTKARISTRLYFR